MDEQSFLKAKQGQNWNTRTKREILLNNLGKLTPWIKSEVTSLGVILDSDLNFKSHINKVIKTSFFHLRNIARARSLINQKGCWNIDSCLYFKPTWLLQCTFYWPPKNTECLQLLQNSEAQLLTRTKRREHIRPVLTALQWLPVTFRINFKVLLLIYKALNGLGLSYIANYLVSRTQSSVADLLKGPSNTWKKIMDAAFTNYTAKLWNTLPIDIREASLLNI